MLDQPTIFDESFDNAAIARRKDILPKWLYYYTWGVFGFGILYLIFMLWMNFVPMTAITEQNGQVVKTTLDASVSAEAVIAIIAAATIVLLSSILVLTSRRIAIKYNIGFAVILGLMALVATIGGGGGALFVAGLVVIFAPYLIGLFRIKRKWEQIK